MGLDPTIDSLGVYLIFCLPFLSGISSSLTSVDDFSFNYINLVTKHIRCWDKDHYLTFLAVALYLTVH